MTEPTVNERPGHPGEPSRSEPDTPTPSAPPTSTSPPSTDSNPSTAPEGRSDREDATTGATAPPEAADAMAGPSGRIAADGEDGSKSKRRRGTRGGRGRSRSSGGGSSPSSDGGGEDVAPSTDGDNPELPERASQGRPKDPAVAERALVKRPQIGDSRPAPDGGNGAEAPAEKGAGKESARRGAAPDGDPSTGGDAEGDDDDGGDAGKAGGRAGQAPKAGGGGRGGRRDDGGEGQSGSGRGGSRRRRGGRGRAGGGTDSSGRSDQAGSRPKGAHRGREANQPVEAILGGDGPDLDDAAMEKRRGRERNGRPVGRYLMAVSVRPESTQIAVLEGRNLIEHYVSRPADDVAQIHGNIYLGRVQNVLPGMEAAFVDIGTPKNAVLYRGDVQYDSEDVEHGDRARIEEILKPKQSIICQVTKNPIAHKGARLTQEVSLPGRFVVLIPASTTYGISKRLADDERKRLRSILDRVKPPEHGVIVRTAAEGVTSEEISADVRRLLSQWERIEELATKVQAPALLYREPDMAVRVIREEFNDDYRGVVIDDEQLYDEVSDYVASISPAAADRVQHYDRAVEPLSIFERHHVHEQIHKALDRKVWLPSGGSLIIEHTEALTVIDVNTGKNVGSSSLEETVFRNNLEAAVEIAKQLRLRDIGGIIVIDFIDMEIRRNRDEVIKVFRDALARDKTRTQVFDISELGLVEMTRKRIGEGLLESFSSLCPDCEGRGLVIDQGLLD